MRDRLKQRSVQYTGCWTCKARKIRCDEKPLACGNCEKRGLICGGYDIKLQWLSDPYAQPTISSGQGRRKIELDRTNGLRYSMKEIEDFLSTIDNDHRSEQSLRKGPFSTFSVRTGNSEYQFMRESQLPHAPIIPIHSEESQFVEYSDNHALPAGLHRNINMTKSPDLSLAQGLPFSLPFNGYFNEVTTKTFDFSSIYASSTVDCEEIVDEHNTSPNIRLENNNVDATSLDIYSGSHISDLSTIIMQTAASTTYGVTHLPHQNLQISLSDDADINMLMHHYIVNVADVLQPIQHLHNTYRDMYVPTALEGGLIPISDPKTSDKKAHSALFHALLASAAFHLWNSDKAQTKFHNMGTQHRCQSLHLLQSALSSPTLASNYKSLLMAMLALLTIGLMSGQVEDFAVHLKGTVQLRNSRRHWRIMSGSTRQLNEISAFLTLLTRTLSFQISPSSWIGSNSDISYSDDLADATQPGRCYVYMYGITPNIAAAIQETCRLSELLAQLDNDQRQNSELLLFEECEALGNRLLSWSLESEKAASTLAGNDTMSTIFEHHAKAWHYATLIYYYYRIQHYDAENLVEHVESVAKHMHLIEDIKAKSKCETMNKMAPITWPMFIASCTSTQPKRETHRRWWERVKNYGIANIRRQWDVVQMIWQKGDEMEQEGFGKSNWIHIYCHLGINLLPI